MLPVSPRRDRALLGVYQNNRARRDHRIQSKVAFSDDPPACKTGVTDRPPLPATWSRRVVDREEGNPAADILLGLATALPSTTWWRSDWTVV